MYVQAIWGMRLRLYARQHIQILCDTGIQTLQSIQNYTREFYRCTLKSSVNSMQVATISNVTKCFHVSQLELSHLTAVMIPWSEENFSTVEHLPMSCIQSNWMQLGQGVIVEFQMSAQDLVHEARLLHTILPLLQQWAEIAWLTDSHTCTFNPFLMWGSLVKETKEHMAVLARLVIALWPCSDGA
jgi:hypothetical protein